MAGRNEMDNDPLAETRVMQGELVPPCVSTVHSAEFEVAPGASNPAGTPGTPVRIGRYRIERLLGRGGFGRVFLAHDEQLQRPVAVKVPHAERVSGPLQAAQYLEEARLVASLAHPNIVPVYDVGGTDQFPCYIVSKYVDGA